MGREKKQQQKAIKVANWDYFSKAAGFTVLCECFTAAACGSHWRDNISVCMECAIRQTGNDEPPW